MESHPASRMDTWTFRRVMWATIVLVIIAASFWLLYRFYQVIFILFIAIILGTAIRPIVMWLSRRGISRLAGAILVYTLLLALTISFLLLLFPLILDQGVTVVAAVPGYYQGFREWLVNYPSPLILRFSEFLPETLTDLEPTQQTGQQVLALAGQAMDYMASAARTLFTLTAILLLAFHWTLDGPRTIQSLLRVIPPEQQESISSIIAVMETKVSFSIAGQGALCLFIGVMALVAYLLIGLPNALVLALVAGVLEAVPYIGPTLGAIPAGVIALSISPSKLVWVIVATVIIQQIENNLLVPRVMRRAVGVNPFVSLLSIFTFSSLFGIAGALMAIPIAAIIQILLDRFVFHTGSTEAEELAGRDQTSLLRYEIQDLAKGLRRQARVTKVGSARNVRQIDRVMDEIESITTDLDVLLAQIPPAGAP